MSWTSAVKRMVARSVVRSVLVLTPRRVMSVHRRRRRMFVAGFLAVGGDEEDIDGIGGPAPGCAPACVPVWDPCRAQGSRAQDTSISRRAPPRPADAGFRSRGDGW